MKIAVLILAVAIIGAFAQDVTTPVGPPPFVCDSTNTFVCTFKELGHKIKYHAKKLGGKLAEVGNSLLGTALEHGKNLLTTGSSAVAKTLLNHLNNEGIVGKRAILSDKLKEHIGKGMDKLKEMKKRLHAAFKKAVTKLTGMMADKSALKGVEDDTDKKIDAAVDEFSKDNKKGFFGMAKTVFQKLQDIFQAGMEKLREKMGKKSEKKVEERAIADLWRKAKEHLSGLAGTIKDTFKPHMDALQKGVKDLAEKAKTHGANLTQAAKDSFNDLKTKLAEQIETLKGHAGTLTEHGKNALNELKAAVASIAKSALGDAVAAIVKQ